MWRSLRQIKAPVSAGSALSSVGFEEPAAAFLLPGTVESSK